MARARECEECGRTFYGYGKVCPKCAGEAGEWADKGGPFYRGDPGKCPVCGARSRITATGQGDWEEDRVCSSGHRFHVSFQHSNDPGTVTEVYGEETR